MRRVVSFLIECALLGLGPGWKAWPPFSVRAKYRGEVLECVSTIMMRDGTFPGLDEITDVAFNEQWPADETAVLYAGNVLARKIEELPNAGARTHRRAYARAVSEPNSAQFDALMLRVSLSLANLEPIVESSFRGACSGLWATSGGCARITTSIRQTSIGLSAE